MPKDTLFIAMALLCLVALGGALAYAVWGGPADDGHIKAIEKTLVGMNLTYSNIAGQPMNYTIGSNDIQGIEKTEYNGQPAWKVRVGQGLSWDLTMDQAGEKILDTKQLFYT